MIEIAYGICVFILLVGTITDLKIREVPDWLNYSGIAAGLGLRLIWSLHSFDWSFILEGLLGFGVFFALAVAMFYLGQWGGGDSKVLMALGALLGLQLDFNHMAVLFLVNAVIVGGIYGILYSTGLAVLNWKKFKRVFFKLRANPRYIKVRKLLLVVLIVLFAIAIFNQDAYMRLIFLFPAVFFAFMFYLILLVKSVEKCCMYKLVPPKELTEGDWIAKDIRVKGKRICGPKDLGIEKKQIQQLVKLKVKKVLIKVGIPFVPSFLIAFLITLWIGNPLVYLI